METKAQEDIIKELLVYQKKLARNTKISFMISIILCAVILVTFILLVPRVYTELENIDQSLAVINQAVEDAEVLIENANTMITQNTDAVTETVRKLNSVEFDVLNQAIENLNRAIEPLADFADLFSK